MVENCVLNLCSFQMVFGERVLIPDIYEGFTKCPFICMLYLIITYLQVSFFCYPILWRKPRRQGNREPQSDIKEKGYAQTLFPSPSVGGPQKAKILSKAIGKWKQ